MQCILFCHHVFLFLFDEVYVAALAALDYFYLSPSSPKHVWIAMASLFERHRKRVFSIEEAAVHFREIRVVAVLEPSIHAGRRWM